MSQDPRSPRKVDELLAESRALELQLHRSSLLDRVIRFCLENKLVVVLVALAIIGGGIYFAPFDWHIRGFERAPVPVDAVPDIGENQQIVFTDWPGRSPQDVEDQVTYPLTIALLGIPGVRSIRSSSMFGFSSIYVIFEDKIDFYWSRSRVLERLSALPAGTLPPGVTPRLGPDATALGQVFWYTLEGEGFSLEELRSIQDWDVRFRLNSAQGVSEVASVGGFVREYQVDVDPDAMRSFNVTLDEVIDAVQRANIDVGAKSIEINRVEYQIRGRGFIRTTEDIENAVVKVNENVPVYVKNVAHVWTGPEYRRGALMKNGAEVVGGVVVVRYGENPLQVIKNVKKKIEEISPGLPRKVLPDGRVSQVRIVPFYDRTKLIYETLNTLQEAIFLQVMVTIIVVMIMERHVQSSLLISGLLPLAVLLSFVAMKVFKIDSNLMSLSGIAIAIGTIVDMGVILCDNMLRHLREAPPDEPRIEVVFRATSEVGSAVLTAIATTVVSFLAVFTMSGPEGKLFKPLAYTKTFCLIASVLIALTVLPAMAHVLFATKVRRSIWRHTLSGVVVVGGFILAVTVSPLAGWAVVAYGAYRIAAGFLPGRTASILPWLANCIAVAFVLFFLTRRWLPLGPDKRFIANFLFVAGAIGGWLGMFLLVEHYYERILRLFLRHKVAFLSAPAILVVFGLSIWLGFDRVFGVVPKAVKAVGIDPQIIRSTTLWTTVSHALPGLGKEFMPPLDEGSFLHMPTTMPHTSIGEALDILQKQTIAISQIPEVESVVGKLGRVDSALDPAPIEMFETVINYKDEYLLDPVTGQRVVDEQSNQPIRLWGPDVQTPDDIWRKIVKAGEVPGTTTAPRLQPIAARIVMLQTGVRAPMAVRIRGASLEDLEQVSLQVERLLKEVPSIEPATVVADRIIGAPYLEITIDRQAIARYGVRIRDVQDVIEMAIGGERITTTVEGRERYPVRVRYPRELRDSPEELMRVLVPTAEGAQIPLAQLASIEYVRGPGVIKSENASLVGYVLFDKQPQFAEVDVVEAAMAYMDSKLASGEFVLPAGVEKPTFIGTYENQVRAMRTLMLVVPTSLFIIFLLLYLQFRRVSTTVLCFSAIAVAWSGAFLMIWLYGRPWFMNFSVLGVPMRELFQVHQINLSVAVWVGFIALFGIATDDAVVMCTYLDQSFAAQSPATLQEIRDATLYAGSRRIRPCLMTTATTILALLPVLTSTGRGADVMVPMAIPSFGGMTIELMTLFVTPVVYCFLREIRLKKNR